MMLKSFVSFFLLIGISVFAEQNSVADKYNKIEWQDNGEKEIDIWKMGRSYCSQLEWSGHDDWRLPTKEELVSLSKHDDIKFKHMKDDIYWSLENDPHDSFNAITVYTGNGFVSVSDKCDAYAFICVRDDKK